MLQRGCSPSPSAVGPFVEVTGLGVDRADRLAGNADRQVHDATSVDVRDREGTAEEVGVYFAVIKTLALVSFIHYAMAATTAHRFAEYHAQDDKPRLSAYVAHAIQWTFWPSLAA